MDALERTAQTKQPFASVDNPPVLLLSDLQPAIEDDLSDSTRSFVKEIYEHWKTRRLRTNNRPLVPSLKVWLPRYTFHAQLTRCAVREQFGNRRLRPIRVL